MGYMSHHSIIITTWDDKITTIHRKAIKIFGKEGVSEITPTMVNGYRSFFIPPDGSKEGWEGSDTGNENRDSFKEWIYKSKIYCAWAEVQFGDDDGITKIIDHDDDYRGR